MKEDGLVGPGSQAGPKVPQSTPPFLHILRMSVMNVLFGSGGFLPSSPLGGCLSPWPEPHMQRTEPYAAAACWSLSQVNDQTTGLF